ncbi:MAG: esterase-like activity of phytase family protein [Bacteroidetes bacterium]|nr:esterase-like activity of phytase family protein [Bacteroidota bacterium]
MKNKSNVLGLILLTLVIAYSGSAQPTTSISKLRFINEYVVAFDQPFKGTSIGGLSGIDYNKNTDTYFLICDDGEAHYYQAKIDFTIRGIDSVRFTDVAYFLTAGGERIQPVKKTGGEVDPESIRINVPAQTIFWTSEGKRAAQQQLSIDPTIYQSKLNGEWIGKLSTPENAKMSTTEKGTRNNGAFEGTAFADDYKTYFVSLEEPLYQDGPRASLTPTNSWVRFYKYRISDMKNVAQYAYKLDPIALPAVPQNAFSVNGVSEILSTGSNTLLVMERSFSSGHLGCTIKIFQADLAGTSNVKSVSSLAATPPIKEIQKELILNMDDLKMYIDNIEGFTFGPDFPNGHKSLIFVSDNNFNPFQKTQFLLFEVIP